MTHPVFPHLFRPLSVGPFILKNRVIMGSMHMGLEEMPGGFDRLAAFFARRAQGGVGLIVTGGISPDETGRMAEGAAKLSTEAEAHAHRVIPEAVHAAGGRILMQILHTGRYGFHDRIVAPSALKAPINLFTPREMTGAEIESLVAAFAETARLAESAGYDGVEIMGSEGYLLNQFFSPATNRRTDSWGGSVENRMRLPVAVVSAVRAAVSAHFLVMFRVSLADFVAGGSRWTEITALASAVASAGANILNTGIGWHEARIPTIAAVVPRAAFSPLTARLKQSVSVPVVAVNRINTPMIAEKILARGEADLVSLARPLLADPDFVKKAEAGDETAINTCVACNQACLDHIFEGKPAGCLVNPKAGDAAETTPGTKTAAPRRVAVVGAGPSGLSAALSAAERGHEVTIFEANNFIGGQLSLAMEVPGKAEFGEMLRYYEVMLERYGVTVRLCTPVTAEEIRAAGFDVVVAATGVVPRLPEIPGIDHSMVVTYAAVLSGEKTVGRRVALIGAGGIGFDTAVFLTHETAVAEDRAVFSNYWGIDPATENPGGLDPEGPKPGPAPRTVYLLQRKPDRMGKNLGKTTGWIHRRMLKMRGVVMIPGVTYERIDDSGLHSTVTGEKRRLSVDNVVVCAGQESVRGPADALTKAGIPVHIIGGAEEPLGLDAKSAVEAGMRIAARL